MADTYRVQLYETVEALKRNPGGKDMSVLSYEGNKKESHSLFVVTEKTNCLITLFLFLAQLPRLT